MHLQIAESFKGFLAKSKMYGKVGKEEQESVEPQLSVEDRRERREVHSALVAVEFIICSGEISPEDERPGDREQARVYVVRDDGEREERETERDITGDIVGGERTISGLFVPINI